MGRNAHQYEMCRSIHPPLGGDHGGADGGDGGDRAQFGECVSGVGDGGVYPSSATVGSNVGASHPVRTCARSVVPPRSAPRSVRRTEEEHTG